MVYTHNINNNNKINVKDDDKKNYKIKYDYNTVKRLVTEQNVNNFVVRESKNDKTIETKKKYNFDIY